MNEIITEVLSYAKAMWRYRWLSLIIAWAVSITGWIFVILLPDKFESEARIYVDTGSLLAPLLKGIAVENNLDQEVTIMQRTLLSRPNLEQVMRMNDLDLTATEPDEVEAMLAGLARDISITAQTKNLFSIAYSHTNPRQAQSVVQSILTIFVENNLGESRTDMESARGFIEKQIAEYERQLRQAEQRLDCRVRQYGPWTQEHPGAFTPPFGYACFVQYLDVAGHARLALSQNLHDLAYGKFQLPYQQRDSHPRRIGKRTHYVE